MLWLLRHDWQGTSKRQVDKNITVGRSDEHEQSGITSTEIVPQSEKL